VAWVLSPGPARPRSSHSSTGSIPTPLSRDQFHSLETFSAPTVSRREHAHAWTELGLLRIWRFNAAPSSDLVTVALTEARADRAISLGRFEGGYTDPSITQAGLQNDPVHSTGRIGLHCATCYSFSSSGVGVSRRLVYGLLRLPLWFLRVRPSTPPHGTKDGQR